MLKKGILILLIFNLTACSYFKKKEMYDAKKPIAKVDTVFLYKEDILEILPVNYRKKDSVLLVTNFINSWAKKQLLLSKARLNLTDDEKTIKKLVKKYHEDLLINKYRQAVINQNIDTLISDNEIDEFYTKNKEILKLNEELLQLKFIHTGAKIINKKELISLFKSNKKEDLEALVDKELEFKSFYFNDSVWIKHSDVLKNIPLLKKEEFINLKKPRFIVKEDSLDLYLIKINKVLKRNSISPKSYVTPTVKQMILHTRKLKLLKEIEQTLLNDAIKNGQYEIYK